MPVELKKGSDLNDSSLGIGLNGMRELDTEFGGSSVIAN